jgi:glycosyltransferase involved in cell wall biosynthesis
MKQLSIIVPVYNVEKYVRACMESIFNQGLDEECYEVIIVNDGTQDRSMEVIADIIQQHDNITVINQENQSLSVARNNGIAAAKGEYVFMPDSDDLLLENSLKPLLEIALETKVDLVVADFLSMTDEEIDDFYKKEFQQPELQFKEGTGEQLFLEELNPYHCYVWRTLYRRDFIVNNQLSFFPGIRYQDVPFTHECYIRAKSYIKTNVVLNLYRNWPKAFKIDNSKSFIIAIAQTWKLRQIEGLTPRVIYKLEEDVYTSFRLIIFDTLSFYKTASERNYVIDYLNDNCSTLNFTHGFQQKLFTFMVKRMPHLFINLYYYYKKVKG